MNEKKVDRVARAICWAASNKDAVTGTCVHCSAKVKEDCSMTEQFRDEAIAAIREAAR